MPNSSSRFEQIRYLRATGILILWMLDCVVCDSHRACPAGEIQTERTIAFPFDGPIRGSAYLFRSPATVLIGEIHGTWESPLLVASLVRSASRNHVPTILCLELSSAEQPLIDQFLQSDGGDAAVAALLSGPHWSGKDGRASVGQFALMELLRRLKRQDHGVRVVAIDIEMPTFDPNDIGQKKIRQIVKKRDQTMAEKVLAVRKRYPRAHVIVLTGNVHAKATPGTSWDPDFVPMGWHVVQKIPGAISLKVQSSGGQAWVATDQGFGPTRLEGVDRGSVPFIELFDQQKDGYHGLFYVGESSAAPPVSDHRERKGGSKGKDN